MQVRDRWNDVLLQVGHVVRTLRIASLSAGGVACPAPQNDLLPFVPIDPSALVGRTAVSDHTKVLGLRARAPFGCAEALARRASDCRTLRPPESRTVDRLHPAQSWTTAPAAISPIIAMAHRLERPGQFDDGIICLCKSRSYHENLAAIASAAASAVHISGRSSGSQGCGRFSSVFRPCDDSPMISRSSIAISIAAGSDASRSGLRLRSFRKKAWNAITPEGSSSTFAFSLRMNSMAARRPLRRSRRRSTIWCGPRER